MLFAFESLDKHGARFDGAIEASGEAAAIEELRAHGYYPLGVQPAPGGAKPIKLDGLARPFTLTDLPLEDFIKKSDELYEGNDAAYDELLRMLEWALGNLEGYTGPGVDVIRETFQSQQEILTKAGSPEAARRHSAEVRRKHQESVERAMAGDLEEIKRDAWTVGPGRLSSVGSKIYENERGEILIFGRRAVFFHRFADEKRAEKLCAPDTITDMKLKGFRAPVLHIDTMDGPGWTFALDWEGLDKAARDRQRKSIFMFKFLTSETKDPSLLPRTPIAQTIPFMLLGMACRGIAGVFLKYWWLIALVVALTIGYRYYR